MKPEDFSIARALLRGITDEIERAPRAPVQQERIADSIARVRAISTRASAHMRAALADAYPDIGWSASEDRHGPATDVSRYWVFDPIDGAYHFLQGLPLWSSTLALLEDGKVTLSLVYAPHNQELFTAQEGQGATLNGSPIQASLKSDLSCAVAGSAVPPRGSVTDEEHAHALQVFATASHHVFVMRQMAAASLQLAYVAAGRLDVYVETGSDVYDWAAGALLVQEAGGTVTGLDGSPFDTRSVGILAAGRALHAQMLTPLARGSAPHPGTATVRTPGCIRG
jgi:myo-inositol-1(or 4)-monophosphatase